MKLLSVSIIIILLTSASLPAPQKHPVHFSVCNIEYFKSDKQIKGTLRIFFDDFERILNHNYNTKLNLGTPLESVKANLYIKTYLMQHFKIFTDNNHQQLNLILKNKVIDKAENTCTLNIEFNVKFHKIIRIENTILTDLYTDQNNLLIFTASDQQFAHKFNDSDTQVSFEINN